MSASDRPTPTLRRRLARAMAIAGAVALARAVALAAAALAVVASAAAPPAAAGGFRVSQCHAVADGMFAPLGWQAGAWSVANGWPEVECGGGAGVIRLGVPNWRLAENADATLRFAVPGSMPQTTARGAWIDWRFNAQSWSTNPAFLSVTSSGARLLTGYPGERATTWRELPSGSRALELSVWCSPVNGPGWCTWPGAPLELRGLTVELEESGQPAAGIGGALAGGGAHSGVEPLEIVATDGDSGVRSVAVSLGGTAVGALEPAGGCREDRLPPCPQSLRGTVDVDTRRIADGERRLRLVVTDAAGNARTVDAATVRIANQPVAGSPAVPDPGPGPAGATPTPSAGPAGPPDPPDRNATAPVPFPPNPLAGRGHVPNGRNAGERAWVDAWLEPRRGPSGAPQRRRSAAVPRGVRVRIRGRLTNVRGRPIAGAALAAIRREPGRPWRPVTGVRTRPDGRFTAFTRVGPSQELRFVYYAFGDSTRGARSARLRVRVLPR